MSYCIVVLALLNRQLMHIQMSCKKKIHVQNWILKRTSRKNLQLEQHQEANRPSMNITGDGDSEHYNDQNPYRTVTGKIEKQNAQTQMEGSLET